MILTCLIHLGYDQNTQTAFIPNEEIRQELTNATRRKKWGELIGFWQKSEELLDAALNKDCSLVAKMMERIHTEYAAAICYNNESSLGGVLAIGYLSAMQYYFRPVRELPAGRGFADFVLLPKPDYIPEYPAILAELKWDKNAHTAIQQIKEISAVHCALYR